VEYFGEDPLILPRLAGICLEPPSGPGPPVPARVARVRVSPPGILVSLEGLTSREEAERFRGFFLSAPRASLPEPAEDELYQADVIGLPVVTEGGRELGTAAGFLEGGGAPLLAILTPAGGSLHVPWAEGYVLEADTAGRVVVADVPGLLDED
jgi:16S rRNA processing protein RimM